MTITIDPVHDPRDRVEITLHRTHEGELCSHRYTFINIADAKQFMDGASYAEPDDGSHQTFWAGMEIPCSPRASAAIDRQIESEGDIFSTPKLPTKEDSA